MKKIEFLATLSARLSSLTDEEINEHIGFYSEMIDDRIDSGLSEDEAVADIGSVDDIASQILSERTEGSSETDNPIKKATSRIKATAISLIAVGSPLWVPLLVAAVVIVASLYAVLWSLLVSVWAVFVALSVGGAGLTIFGAVMAVTNALPRGLLFIGCGFVSIGLSIFTFFICIYSTKCIVWFTKCLYRWLKKLINRKEA